MSDKVLYALAAIFNSPDDIINAAKKVSEAGYTKFDVNTPYPVHGMDGAMKLKPSKLGYVALVFGLTGTVLALAFMAWTITVDYPLVIGGKPYFAFPAYVPIMFEVTVLLATIATVVTMLFIIFKFPNNSHPIHDTEYMKKVSSDKYGLFIQTDDPNFDNTKVRLLFSELNAAEVHEIFYDEEEASVKPRIFEPKFITLLIAVFVVVSGTVYFSLNKLMFMTPFNWMMEQEKIIPQESYAMFADGFGMRTPPKESVARNQEDYEFYGKPDEAAVKMVNPLLPTKENLKLGKTKFDIYCSPCHGFHAEGDSRLNGQFPNPPSLHSEKVRNWTDGRIYHVIMEGQNVMPSYASQLNRQERWAVILYIRALQRSLNAKESDLE